jgi:hypothetical protein
LPTVSTQLFLVRLKSPIDLTTFISPTQIFPKSAWLIEYDAPLSLTIIYPIDPQVAIFYPINQRERIKSLSKYSTFGPPMSAKHKSEKFAT